MANGKDYTYITKSREVNREEISEIGGRLR